MMTFNENKLKDVYKEAYVWIWLPDEINPVVAGKLEVDGQQLFFNYGKSYLERKNAIALYDLELPMQQGKIPLLNGLNIPGCIRDGSPDAWGRRVLINKKFGIQPSQTNEVELSELTFLLESGSDRIGALDFQLSATKYIARQSINATLDELLQSADKVEQGIPLTEELDQALQHGTSIGGARPKALIEQDGKKFIAKFSSSSDVYSVVKLEFIAMRLAKIIGLNVAPVLLTKASGKDVLLIERFDRINTNKGWQRKIVLSSLTLFGLDEMMARYASYEELAHIIRYRFRQPKNTLKELYSRLVFNILIGNTDDHARNHAAFWDGDMLTLTPVYDLCPQGRTGNEATQAMLISGQNRMSNLNSCLQAAPQFLLSSQIAIDVIEQQIDGLIEHWELVCHDAQLSDVDQNLTWRRQFLNPYIFEGLSFDLSSKLASKLSF